MMPTHPCEHICCRQKQVGKEILEGEAAAALQPLALRSDGARLLFCQRPCCVLVHHVARPHLSQADESRQEELEGDAAAALYRPPALRIDGRQAAALLAEAERMAAELDGRPLPAEAPVRAS